MPARWKQHLGKLQARLLGQLTRRTPTETAFLLLLPVLGLVIGLASVSIAHFIDSLQRLIWGSKGFLPEDLTGTPRVMLVLLPMLGGLVVGLISWLFKTETRGGGTAGIIQAVALKGGLVSLRRIMPRVGAAIITIATGGSLGREGPMAVL